MAVVQVTDEVIGGEHCWLLNGAACRGELTFLANHFVKLTVHLFDIALGGGRTKTPHCMETYF